MRYLLELDHNMIVIEFNHITIEYEFFTHVKYSICKI